MDIKDIKYKPKFSTTELSKTTAFNRPFIEDAEGDGCVGCFLYWWCDEQWSGRPTGKVPTYVEYVLFCGIRFCNPVSFAEYRRELPVCIYNEQAGESGTEPSSNLPTLIDTATAG